MDNQNPNKPEESGQTAEEFGTGGTNPTQPEPPAAPAQPVQPAQPTQPAPIEEPKPAEAPLPQPVAPAPSAKPAEAPAPAPKTEPIAPAPKTEQVAPAPKTEPIAPTPAETPVAPAPAPPQKPQPPKVVPPQPQAPKVAPAVTPPPGKRMLTKDEIMQRDSKRNRRILFGCLSSFGCGTIILIILIFVFVGQSGDGSNALAQALGVDQQGLIDTLTLIINFFFGASALTAFILSIGGFFKRMMARKDDKVAKRKGLMLAGISFIALILIIIFWVGAWFYLNSQRVSVQPTVVTIQTTPEVTINLTAPIEISFDTSQLSYEQDTYDIISYFWDFGDGSAGPGSSIETHRYETKGTGRYDVKLTLTFRNKATGEESTQSLDHIVTVADEKVAAVIEADVTEGNAPLKVRFDGSESVDPDGIISTYAWSVDGASFQEGNAIFENTFEQLGTYTVRLRVTNAKGDFDIAEETIVVGAGDVPVAVIDILNATVDKLLAGQSYTFDASDSVSPTGTITGYEWDFGDGSSPSKTRSTQHTFEEPGTYNVVLTVTDDENRTGENALEVEVKTPASAPSAEIITVPGKAKAEDNFIEGTIPLEVNFDGTQSTDIDDDIVDYRWDFDNDGEFDAVGDTASWVFTETGSFTVTLMVVDSQGLEGKQALVVRVLSKGLEPRVNADPVSGVIPLTVNFDASDSTYSDGQIVSYEWDFGDGSLPRSDIDTVTYKYTKIGTFTAKVTIRTDDGKSDIAEVPIAVRPVALKSCFEAVPTVGDAPLIVSFNPQCATGTIAKYRWDFGDGETSAERKPTHTFTNPGSYEVELEVSDAQNVLDHSAQFITVTGELTQ